MCLSIHIKLQYEYFIIILCMVSTIFSVCLCFTISVVAILIRYTMVTAFFFILALSQNACNTNVVTSSRFNSIVYVFILKIFSIFFFFVFKNILYVFFSLYFLYRKIECLFRSYIHIKPCILVSSFVLLSLCVEPITSTLFSQCV